MAENILKNNKEKEEKEEETINDDDDDVDDDELLNESKSSVNKRLKRDTIDDGVVGGCSYDLQVTQPTFGRRMRLWSKTRFHITIQPNGTVIGVQEDNIPNSELEMESVGKTIGEVRIRGLQTGLYLAMNKKGRVYGEKNKEMPQTIWIEDFYGLSYSIYLSKHWAHLGWYLALKKNGKPKNGTKTKLGQKAMQFLPIRNIEKN